MNVAVVIPVWNGASVIEACLTAVFSQTHAHLHEVICVDNGSHDQSKQLIEAQFPQVTLLPQPVNLGFAGGVNVVCARPRPICWCCSTRIAWCSPAGWRPCARLWKITKIWGSWAAVF